MAERLGIEVKVQALRQEKQSAIEPLDALAGQRARTKTPYMW